MAPDAGGTTVTITGTGFTGATGVDFGTNPATALSVRSDTSMTAISPPGAGSALVTVTTEAGTSQPRGACNCGFEYLAPPAVTAITPSGGPVAGGTRVLILGSGFDLRSVVYFGTMPGTDIGVGRAAGHLPSRSGRRGRDRRRLGDDVEPNGRLIEE